MRDFWRFLVLVAVLVGLVGILGRPRGLTAMWSGINRFFTTVFKAELGRL